MITLTIENSGDAPAGGAKSHVSIKDTLPEGLEALKGAEVLLGTRTEGANTTVPLNCTLATLTCVLEETLAPTSSLKSASRSRCLKVRTQAN